MQNSIKSIWQYQIMFNSFSKCSYGYMIIFVIDNPPLYLVIISLSIQAYVVFINRRQ